MTQQTTNHSPNRQQLALGAILLIGSLLVCLVLGIWLAHRTQLITLPASAEAILYVDAPGRIGIDGTLQVYGPAPIPVAAGHHTVLFLEDQASPPLEVTVANGEFKYVTNPVRPPLYYYDQTYSSMVHSQAFPPNTSIVI